MKDFNDVMSGVDEVINNAKSGNFDEIIEKTKVYADKAAKISAEGLEISKKKIELLDAKAKLSKAYEKFGILVYSQNEGEDVSEESWNSAIAEIKLHKTRKEILDKDIEELKAKFSKAQPKNESEKTDAE